MDDGLEKKVGFLDSVTSYYYGKDFVEADLAPGSEMVFALNKHHGHYNAAKKAADVARAGVVEALKIGGYLAAIGFAYTWIMR
ncbi:hypothetical protein JXB28_00995 [Candidatus Woesearchaeota archaeon]|nr:hypothetical protein [Candidatus Woesearchaeota archaeon]